MVQPGSPAAAGLGARGSRFKPQTCVTVRGLIDGSKYRNLTPLTLDRNVSNLQVSKAQAKRYIDHLMEQGVVEIWSHPVPYRSII